MTDTPVVGRSINAKSHVKMQTMFHPDLGSDTRQRLDIKRPMSPSRGRTLYAGLVAASSIAMTLSAIQAAPVAAHFESILDYELSGGVNSIQVVGDKAYVAASEAGVVILDTSDPAHLKKLGEIDTPGFALALQVVGNIAYVADGEAGLRILDVSDPSAPKALGDFNPNSFANHIRVVGTTAYLSCGETGLVILDVSNPGSPQKLSEYVVTNDRFPAAYGVEVVDSVAYVSYGTLEILDVSVPTDPKPLSNLGFLNVYSSAIVGNRAYLATGVEGLVIYDISNPSKPVRITKIPAPLPTFSIHVAGDTVYTESGILDVSNPVAPRIIAKNNLFVYGGGSVQRIGEYLLYPMGNPIVSVHKARFGLPQNLGWPYGPDRVIPPQTTQPIGMTNSSGLPIDVQVLRGSATLSNGQITVTGNDTVQLRFSHPGDATYLPVDEIRTINQPYAVLQSLGHYPLTGFTYAARVKDQLAFVSNDDGGLHIVDVSNPASPVRVGGFKSTNQTLETEIVGNYAYLADGTNGFRVLDITLPSQPVEVAVAEAGTAIAVRIVGNSAYVLDFGKRMLRTFDVSNPKQLVQTAQNELNGDVRNIQVVGTNAYVSAGYGGVIRMDVTDPAHPITKNTLYSEAYVRGLQVVGNTLFVPDYFSGTLVSLDITNPEQPTLLGKTETGGSPRRVEILGNLAFLVTEGEGLLVLDISDPTRMPVIGRIDTGGYARDIQLKDGLIYVADQNTGLKIFKVESLGLRATLSMEMPERIAFGETLALKGNASNGKAIKYSVLSGKAILEGDKLKPTGIGPVILRASVDSDELFHTIVRDISVVTVLPELALRRTLDSIEAVWPSGLDQVQLQRTDSVGTDSIWTSVPTDPKTVDNLASVRLDTATPQGFLRLHSLYSGLGEPIEATGWNRDVVLENTPTPRADPFSFDGATWFENGLDGFNDGLAVTREYRSLIDPTVVFKLQPYDGNNALLLTADSPTNSLVLKNPVALSTLHILSAYTFTETKPCGLIIHYADGSISETKSFVTHEWYASTPNGKPVPSVFAGVGRSASNQEFVYSRFNNGFSLFQSEIPLNEGPNAGKAITRLEFIRPDSDFITVGIYAISGVRIPTRP